MRCMTVVTRLSSVTFSGGSELDIPETGVVVLVGPNNSGKSAALREIRERLTGTARPPDQPFRVIAGVTLDKQGDQQELETWLEQNCHSILIRSSGERQFSRPGVRVGLNQAIQEWSGYPNALGPNVTQLFVLPAFTEQRLGLIGQASLWNPMDDGPSQPLQVLFEDVELDARLSAIADEAFGFPLHLSRIPGGNLDLYLGTPENEPTMLTINHDYLDELRTMPLLREQGDGMRSFMGVMLALIAATYPIVLIDEPEAFLHPPQARLLGERIATESEHTQVVVATHSIDVLLGLLRTGAANVTVVRLTREGDINPISVLPHAETRALWSDPLLASSNLLDGLFHRGVVLCEGDTDARYYSSVLEADRGDRAHELFFTHCGGKARMPMVINALRALRVPVVAIADIDVFRERSRVQAIVEALGGSWDAFDHDWRVVDSAARTMGAAPSITDVEEAIEQALSDTRAEGPRLTLQASERIRAATKVSDGWTLLKNGGVAALPQGAESQSGANLLTALERVGLFVVPVGEVERWHREVAHRSSAWLNDVVSEELYATQGPHRDFVGRIATSFGLD
jgi:hypothetical protein